MHIILTDSGVAQKLREEPLQPFKDIDAFHFEARTRELGGEVVAVAERVDPQVLLGGATEDTFQSFHLELKPHAKCSFKRTFSSVHYRTGVLVSEGRAVRVRIA